jgi:GT2 family glycosyltransferase
MINENTRETLKKELNFQFSYQSVTADILVVVKDEYQHTKRFLQSLSKTTDNYKLYIWDNGSKKPTSSLLKKSNPHCLIRSEENLGFIKPNNALFKKCTSQYTILLNNDTILSPGWKEAMIGYLQNNPNTGVIGYQGGFLNSDFIGHKFGSGANIDYVCGWALCFENKLTNELFDENLEFAYGEDSDFCLTMKSKGFDCYALSLQYIHHIGNATSKKHHDKPAFVKNHLYLKEKWRNNVML